ncbi:MAG TPA: bifunctional riboflavin kinase/FAD synthetase [Polyangiaceae bacterium]|nr:bifunctional riboflavin kinase/FAD synthetase [Polyangiaceae bacterium]
MKARVRASNAIEPGQNSLVVIGNFDGVHLGHRAVIEAALSEARDAGLRPLVLTFEPHPSEVLGGGVRPQLTVLDRKIDLIERLGPELRVVVEPFTLALSRFTPAQFAQEFLIELLSAKVVIVGENFRFGHRRSGDLPALAALGRELGFAAHASSLVGDARGPYSSTRARAALAAGDLAAAEAVLGRPHSLSGVVEQGAQRGRTIGVPTANLGGVAEALPPHGVYAVLVDRVHDGKSAAIGIGVANIGLRPTVHAGFSVEVHLLDFSQDLYGESLRVHLVSRLREEQKFAGLPELKAQIAGDIAQARQALASVQPDPLAAGGWR